MNTMEMNYKISVSTMVMSHLVSLSSFSPFFFWVWGVFFIDIIFLILRKRKENSLREKAAVHGYRYIIDR